MNKSAEAFRTIGEVADELGIPKHVLRFWEGRFPQIRPMKRGGGRRYYRPEDMELLRGIRALLHENGYTIRGVQKILREHGIEQVKSAAIRLSVVQASADGPVSSPRKRGRKPLANSAATAPVPVQPLVSAAPAVDSGRQPAGMMSKVQVLAAIRELEIARAILSGKPLNQRSAATEAKKVRAGKP
jgi:DNA-binding transcriptional MerR regulator